MEDMDAGRWRNIVSLNSVEAQWAVIGSMLIDATCIGPVMAVLQPEDMLDPTCRNTFGAIKSLFLAGKPVDPVTVQQAVDGQEQWVSWARQVLDLTPTAANVMEYAAIVREKALRARVRDAAAALSESAVTASMEELGQKAMAIPGLLSQSGRGRTVTPAELMRDAYRRATSQEKREYLPWGIPSANRAMYVEPGDLVLLGGYPSTGKTLLSIQMAISQARRYRVVYYTLETQPEKMADRIMAHLAQVSLTDIKKSSPTAGDVDRMAEAMVGFVEHTPVTMVHAAHFSVDDIAADALSKRAQVVYIDYVQLVDGPGQTDYARVSGVSRGLKMFAQEHKVCVVALAQLARAEKLVKGGKAVRLPPDMSSLKESGQLEQDADAVFLLWRLDEEDNNSERVLKLGKNKEGRKFATVMRFDGATQTMTDLEVNPRDYQPNRNVAAEFAAHGRAIKAANRAQQFVELKNDGEKNPFENEEEKP